MKVEICERFTHEQVATLLRDVRLRLDPDVRVYREAVVATRLIHPAEVNPAQLYVVEEQLAFQTALRRQLLASAAVDLFRLEGGLRIRVNDGRPRLLLPPIIESTSREVRFQGAHTVFEAKDVRIPVVHDGTHRLFLAHALDMDVRVIWISRVPEAYPFYAHPVSWARVTRVNCKPASKGDRRVYVSTEPDRLYRQFSDLDEYTNL